MSRDSSVNKVTVYGLDEWGQIPGKGYDYSLRHRVHTDSTAHPASPSTPADKKAWRSTSTPHHILMAWCLSIGSNFYHVNSTDTTLRKYLLIITVFQGLGLLACSGSEFIFLKLMNLFGQLVGLFRRGIFPTQGLYLHT
jgi:hypothetical protein